MNVCSNDGLRCSELTLVVEGEIKINYTNQLWMTFIKTLNKDNQGV